MDPNAAQDQRGSKLYRRILVGAAIAVALIAIWMIIPPPETDLSFLKSLKPKFGDDDRSLTFKQKPLEVERALDARLTEGRGWVKVAEIGRASCRERV